ncbi:head decoration protein [Nocardiopsis sp. FR4]|uniref:head decoration protein n=1 Tax=Nocardiopsis sp. FR4 TaxID=2605985 RepID=UPI00135B645C|nr:head decoration protein [Nocardiopsis sp. FR4]
MDLSITEESIGSEDHSWLGSAHGTDTGRTITLDTSLIPAEVYRTGWVPSGLPLGRVTATGLYGPYTPGAENGDGRERFAGVLLTSIRGPKAPGNPIAGALLEHGRVHTNRLPVAIPDASAAQADLPTLILTEGSTL